MKLLRNLFLLACIAPCGFGQLAFAAPFGSQRKVEDAETTTGAWSKVVDGLQGRLSVSEDPMFNGTRMIAVYLELRNVSNVADHIELLYSSENLQGIVTDRSGKEVSVFGTPSNTYFDGPYWLALPCDSSLRFRVSASGYGIPRNGGTLVGLFPHRSGANGPWLLKSDGNAPYFLKGTFDAPSEEDRTKARQWRGRLELPKVQIPMASFKAQLPAKKK